MRRTRIQQDALPQDTPEYLRDYCDRLREAGVDVRLPTARGDLKIALPVKLQGRPLSEVVIALREGA